jgi:hypothetical protein
MVMTEKFSKVSIISSSDDNLKVAQMIGQLVTAQRRMSNAIFQNGLYVFSVQNGFCMTICD